MNYKNFLGELLIMANDRDLIEQAYIERQLPQQVQALPYDVLSVDEQHIIDKINSGKIKELSDEELGIIKKVIGEYHEIAKKYNAEEIIENNKALEQSIATEQELLDMVYSTSDIVLKMKLPFGKEEKVVEFHIKPLDDSRAVKMLEQHIDIFKDLSDEEMKIYEKNGAGQKLDPKEERVLEHINKKITENQTRSQIEEVTNFLAYQIEEPKSLSLEEKKEFWKKFQFMPRMLLYSRVMNELGLSNQANEDLFLD